MEFPSFASATANVSFISLETIFFNAFFKLFDILPSTVAVAAEIQNTRWY